MPLLIISVLLCQAALFCTENSSTQKRNSSWVHFDPEKGLRSLSFSLSLRVTIRMSAATSRRLILCPRSSSLPSVCSLSPRLSIVDSHSFPQTPCALVVLFTISSWYLSLPLACCFLHLVPLSPSAVNVPTRSAGRPLAVARSFPGR